MAVVVVAVVVVVVVVTRVIGAEVLVLAADDPFEACCVQPAPTMSAAAAKPRAVKAGRFMVATLAQGCFTQSRHPGPCPCRVSTNRRRSQHCGPCELQGPFTGTFVTGDRHPRCSR